MWLGLLVLERLRFEPLGLGEFAISNIFPPPSYMSMSRSMSLCSSERKEGSRGRLGAESTYYSGSYAESILFASGLGSRKIAPSSLSLHKIRLSLKNIPGPETRRERERERDPRPHTTTTTVSHEDEGEKFGSCTTQTRPHRPS